MKLVYKYAYVLHRNGKPLMPCSPRKARILLKQSKAKVVRRKPFTIQLLYGSSNYKQPIILGFDPGYINIGLSAITEKKEIFSAEVKLRKDVSKNITNKRMYRRSRRNRLWHRKPRFLNRKKPSNWLAPSIQHKLDSHLRIVEFVKSILPITKTNVEIAKFDIQKIKNPDIKGKKYQEGEKLGFYNIKSYVLYRDGYKCYNCHKNNIRLEIHHIISRKNKGTNKPDNLITLCKVCHKKVTNGKLVLDIKIKKNYKPETFMSTINKKLVNILKANITYGYITKLKRENLNLLKSHFNDAFCIANGKVSIKRTVVYNILQCRRNNRKLRISAKGRKPCLRKSRPLYRPNDLVVLKNKVMSVIRLYGGAKYLGKYIKLKDKLNNIINDKVLNVKTLKYRGGFIYNEDISY